MINQQIESRALLLHRHKQTGTIEITSHDVVPVDSGFTLSAGHVLSPPDYESLVQMLLEAPANDETLLPSQVLVHSSARLVWYVPSTVRTMSFRVNNKIEQVTAPMPSLIIDWQPTQVRVAAYKGKHRPTAETPLFIPPVGNFYEDSTICLGTFHLPSMINYSGMSEIEGFVFEGINTHSGNKNVLKNVDTVDKLFTYFKTIEMKKTFPPAKLVPIKDRSYDQWTLEGWLDDK
jgi:PRTRC genetic system protein B